MTPDNLILAQFPGKVCIGLLQAGEAIGLANQTSYNLYHRGKFPLKVHKMGRKPMVALTELILYLEARGGSAPSTPIPEARRGRGRPRNGDKLAA